MSERHSLIDTITDSIVPVHNDGYKFLAMGAGVSLLLFLLWPPLAWIAVLITAWIAYFFRDPPRVTPLRDGLVVAPAMAASAAIERLRPPAELGLGDVQRMRVSIFLSVFDVHINRSPVAGSHFPVDIRARQLPERGPRQGERGERAARARYHDRKRGRDRGGADCRPYRETDRDVCQRGR